MKKILISLVLLAGSVACFSVPAQRFFQNYQMSDGTIISLTQAGDEFAHWYEDAQGNIYNRNDEGIIVPSTLTKNDMMRRRKASVQYKAAERRRARAASGVKPNLAPKGVVILADFKDLKMQPEHTQAVFNELCNSSNCTVNSYNGKAYPSAAEYFSSQSDGKYRPQFDVFGPVTLSKSYSYYGQNDKKGNDLYATDAVIEACILADQQYPELNFADYDSDKDDFVDFVYVIYAGEGEASGGAESTIWPHNWYIVYAVLPFNEDGEYDEVNGTRLSCCYTEEDIFLDNVLLNNYAMSSELMRDALGGIGTLCHEFGHVMGLPDFYDTNYGVNSDLKLTPNEWNIMDGGSYNGGGHCPPNYDPWEKYFMGWITPENLGTDGQKLTLSANGTEGYKAYQVNKSGKLEAATKEGLNYYFENRQQQGWDEYLPAAGMLIWMVNFDEDAWKGNEPNNTDNAPKYTLEIPSGTRIGQRYGSQNVWPYGTKNSWSGVTGKPLTDMTRNGDKIELIYIEEKEPVEPFELTWMANGELFAKTTSTGKIVLPEATPEGCENGKVFVGWCKDADYESETTAPTFVAAGQAAAEGDIFYAVYAKRSLFGASAYKTDCTGETAVEDVTAEQPAAVKTIRDGQVVIIRSDGEYTILGTKK